MKIRNENKNENKNRHNLVWISQKKRFVCFFYNYRWNCYYYYYYFVLRVEADRKFEYYCHFYYHNSYLYFCCHLYYYFCPVFKKIKNKKNNGKEETETDKKVEDNGEWKLTKKIFNEL